MSDAPRIAIVVFPGSNDDHDAAWALGALGADPILVWHAEQDLPDVAAVVLPGGFSYGDYLRCGAIARFSPALGAVARFAAAGGPVLGICNGFQILCEAGLLPGVLRPNVSLSFICRDVQLVVENAGTLFTARCEPEQQLTIPVELRDVPTQHLHVTDLVHQCVLPVATDVRAHVRHDRDTAAGDCLDAHEREALLEGR